MEDYLKVAKECGLTDEFGDVYVESGQNISKRKELEAYTSHILASQQAAHDAEIAKLKEENDSWQKATAEEENKLIAACDQIQGYLQQLSTANERIAYLEGLVTLKDKALILAQISSCSCLTMTNNPAYHSEHCKYRVMEEAISASAETVQAFRDKLTEQLQKLSVTNILLRVESDLNGHGHEVYAKSVADVEDALSKLSSEVEDYELGIKVAPCTQAVIEPLRREVAMLSNMFQSVWSVIPKEVYFSKDTIDSANEKLSNTQATAQAYEQEVEARVAVKALEQLQEQQGMYDWLWHRCRIIFFPNHDDSLGTYPIEHNPHANKDGRIFIEGKMAAELRATSKKG